MTDMLQDANFQHSYHFKPQMYMSSWEQQVVELPERFLSMPRSIAEVDFACSFNMGIFPEINRIWVAVDNTLYLWNYRNGHSFRRYDGLDQIIVSVELAVPREDAFDVGHTRHERDCRHVLIITTPVEIVVLKVLFSHDNEFGDLQLEPTDLAIPSDNVSMLTVAGTGNGRVFMGGQDGNLYELWYRAYGWQDFLPLGSSRCKKINHTAYRVTALMPAFLTNVRIRDDVSLISVVVDHHRNILYTLSLRSEIRAYYLGEMTDELLPIQTEASSDEVQQMLRRYCHVMRDRKGTPASRVFANANWLARVQVE